VALSVGAPGGSPGNLAQAVSDVANRTLDAAGVGLQRAIDDPGLRFTFYQLTKVVLAAREPDWQTRLSDLGIVLTADSSLFDFTAEVQETVDRYLTSHGPPSDVSEMAQQAAGQAVTELAGPNARTLFGRGAIELRDALKKIYTKAGFARLGQGELPPINADRRKSRGLHKPFCRRCLRYFAVQGCPHIMGGTFRFPRLKGREILGRAGSR
jgi:hypothetical protein